MANRKVQEKHSETAKVAALYRAIAHHQFQGGRLGPDHLAGLFLPRLWRLLAGLGPFRSRILAKTEQMTPGMYQFMLARTAFFDELFLQALEKGLPQIVILGAGYDTRAWRFADKAKGTAIFELDIATTQARKKVILKKAGLPLPANLNLTPIDFNRQSIEQALLPAGFDPEAACLIIWEGTCYYLQDEAVEATLEFAAARPGPESRLGLDYALKIPTELMDQSFGVARLMETWAEHRKGEPFITFIRPGGLAERLNRSGLKLLRSLEAGEMERTYLLSGTGPDQLAFPGRVNAMFGLAEAAPAG